MTIYDIAKLRLYSQFIIPHEVSTPGDLLIRLGAMQAQDYSGALWSIGLRLPGITRTDVEQAIIDRTIVRTWPMRGTLHFVPAADMRWMLRLMTQKVITSSASRHRHLELDEASFIQSEKIITKALEKDKILTRKELFTVLEQNGVSTAGQRGIHVIGWLCMKGTLCFGPHKEKQPTFVLLEDWITHHNNPEKDEALKILVERYFTSHGPATLKDFCGWTGLTIAEAKVGLDLAASVLQKMTIEGKDYWMSRNAQPVKSTQSFLLPGFDEFMLGYKDRSAALPSEYANKICPGNNGMFMPTMVIDGQVGGTWKSIRKTKSLSIEFKPFTSLSSTEKDSLKSPTNAYEKFLGMPVSTI